MRIQLPRRQQRDSWTEPQRIATLEDEMDESDARYDAINKKLNWLVGVAFALLVAVVSGIIVNKYGG